MTEGHAGLIIQLSYNNREPGRKDEQDKYDGINVIKVIKVDYIDIFDRPNNTVIV